MSHLEDLAKSMGISSDELFSGKYGDNYDEILDNIMMKKLNESYANESEFTCPYCKSDDISTDEYEYFKCNNCNRPFDIPHEEPEYDPYTESYAGEYSVGDRASPADQATANHVMVTASNIWDDHGWQSGGDVDDNVYPQELKSALGGTRITKGVLDILEDENYHTEYRILKPYVVESSDVVKAQYDIQGTCPICGRVDRPYTKDDLNGHDPHRHSMYGESYANEAVLMKVEDDDDGDTEVTVLDEWKGESWNRKTFNQKVDALEAVGFRQGKAIRLASLAYEDFSEELQDAIEEQDLIQQSRNDEIKAGIDTDYVENNESELKDRYKCNVCDNSFDELFYSQSGDQGMCPFCGSTYVDEFNVETFVDYNNIGESRTTRSKYECEFCNSGFKSNESLSIHYNDIHAVPPTPVEGYENWKEVANDLYKKELEKRKKYGGEATGDEEGTSDGAKKGWLTRKRGGSQTEEPKSKKSTTKTQTKTNTNLNKVKDKLLSKLDSGSKNYVKVANLDGYPQNSSQLRNVPAGVKGVIMKSHLKDSYDGANFSVRKDGYNALNVSWTGGDGGYPYGAQGITELYSDRGSTNIQVDYFDVDNYVSQMRDERKDKHEKDPWYVADSRESRFGNWISHKINEDWSGYREKFDGHIDNSVTKTMADHILNEPDVTGFNNIKYSDFADLKKEFLEEEKRTGGGNNPKDLPKSSSASSYSQQYMGEDPSKPSEIPYDPNTGEELPVSRFNPNDTKYRQPKETDTVSDMAKAYGDMMAKKKNPDEPMWANGESYANEDWYDDNGVISSVMKWKLVYEDGTDYGFQTDNKAEAQRAVNDWNQSNPSRKIKMVSNESYEDTVRKYIRESYASEDDYKYDFEDLTSLAQDKIEDEGVTQSEWDGTPEEERKELEEEIEEAYNSSDLVCPECGDMTTDDKEFNDHLASHRFDEGDY